MAYYRLKWILLPVGILFLQIFVYNLLFSSKGFFAYHGLLEQKKQIAIDITYLEKQKNEIKKKLQTTFPLYKKLEMFQKQFSLYNEPNITAIRFLGYNETQNANILFDKEVKKIQLIFIITNLFILLSIIYFSYKFLRKKFYITNQFNENIQ